MYSVIDGGVFKRTFLFVLLCTLASGNSATAVELRIKLGSAVLFVLPEVSRCGGYSLTNPQNEHVVTAYNTSYTLINSEYANRGISESLDNGTLLFTMYHIQYSDEGTYLVKPGGRSPQECWKSFALYVIRNSPSTGYWLNWQPWSSCEVTCGPGTKVRVRECSIPSYCFHGNSREAAVCNDNPPCYAWSRWSDWGACSATCGSGVHGRHRYCMTHEHRRTEDKYCSGKTYESQTCSMTRCLVHQPITFQWTNWGPWSTCSQSCGTGFQTRDRQCQYGHTLVDSYRCTGLQIENRTCSLSSCHDERVGTGSDEMLKAGERTVQVPLSVIVGIGAGILLLGLAIVICVLVVKLKRKRRLLNVVKTGSVKKANTISNRTYRGKSGSVISSSSLGLRSSVAHVYDEIESDDVKSQRMSILTIDNPYSMMPRSADTKSGTVAYSNTEETVFVFDSVCPTGQGQTRKVSDAYQNTGNSLAVPRHMSVDSTGYMMPGNAKERAARRNMKYTKHT